MSILINDQEAFVSLTGGMVDAIVRAPDRETFLEVARTVELYYEVMETVTDPDTGETSQVGTGEWQVGKGINIDHLGSVVITPGTYDEDGNELTAPVMDNRHHVNIRLAPPATEKLDDNGNPKWHGWAVAWTQNGQPDPDVNATEEARVYNQVALIDPDSINTPTRVWA